MKNALGLIETKGLVGAIEAVDVACKTADVEVLNKHLVKGGIVTVEIVGDIGAIKVAVEAAAAATKKLGVYIGSHVIARPDEEIYNMLKAKKKEVIVEKPVVSMEVEAIETIEAIEKELKLEIKKNKKNKK